MTYDDLKKDIKILLVDDDLDYIELTYYYLLSKGYNVDKVMDAQKALDLMKVKNYQIMLIDYFMPGMNGEELINIIREDNKEVIIILQTGFSGQKPPIESMQRLNIQNYHDKTEGIDRLNLEIISAVKIFNQQNEIALTKYKSVAIANLVSGIAKEIKESLLSIGAGLEITNMLINEMKNEMYMNNVLKINKYYENNKQCLQKTDRILSAIINQLSQSEVETIMSDEDILEIIELILANELKYRKVILNKKVALKSTSYLKGDVNNTIFIICELIHQVMLVSKEQEQIDFILTEDEKNWVFSIINSNLSNIEKSELSLIENIIISIKNVHYEKQDDKITLYMLKKEEKA